MGCGILDALAAVGNADSVAYLKAAAPVQKLLSPAEMGELFKVLAVGTPDCAPLIGFKDGDRSASL